MKTAPFLILAVLSMLGVCLTAGAQVPAPVISERGAHHRVWTRSTVIQHPNGRIRTNSTSYTELATALHRFDVATGEWVESSNEIELFQGGAVARKAPHQVIFAPNIATPGSVDLQLPDGRRWLTDVEGLVLHDPATGRAQIIAEIKDCVGELHAPNTVIYADAFDTVKASVRYTHNRDRFEQDIVLRERIDLPPGFGPQTRLEIWTALLESPEAITTVRQLGNLSDQRLDFGSMRIGTGHAFMLADPQGKGWSVLMAKRVVMTPDGRRHLVEAVEYGAIQEKLNTLPAPGQGAAAAQPPAVRQMAVNAGQRVFPRRQQAPKPVGTIQLAKTPGPPNAERAAAGGATVRAPGSVAASSTPLTPPALVLDYSILASGSSDYVFRGDSTYLITANCYFSGTSNILEGGAVLKFTNGGSLRFEAPLLCRTAAYLPAVCTSWNDDSIGESITGSSGNPFASFANATALHFEGSAGPVRLQHLRFAHLGAGISFDYDTTGPHDFSHLQFVHCHRAFEMVNVTVPLRNVLMVDVATNFAAHSSFGGTVRGEHVTICRAHKLADTNNGNVATLYLTNSLLVAITNTAAYSGANNASNSEPSAMYQTVGAGNCYLLDNTYRNAGTTNINATLAADLRQLTTYPPTVLSGWMTLDATLSPHVQRDSDLLDLGFHYAPLDYVWASVVHSNATLTIKPGTAIGITHWPSGYGLAQYQGGVIEAHGTASQPIRLARYNTVQEQANTNWVRSGDAVYPAGWATPTPNTARFSFTEWTTLAAGGAHLSAYLPYPAQVTLRDCRFHGGGVYSSRPTLTATNCLFHRVDTGFDDADTYQLGLTFRHCTFAGGFMYGFHGAADAWTFRDNLFDGVDLTWMFAEVTNDFNGYVTNAVCSRLTPNAAHDTVTNASPAYEAGALGRFYLPTNLIFLDVSSTNAHLLGLYHYTALTNQVREGTNRVDLGYHSVALSGTATGSPPADGDNDSLADHYEDLNGDGVVDASETDWTLYTTRYGIGPGPGLVVFTPLK